MKGNEGWNQDCWNQCDTTILHWVPHWHPSLCINFIHHDTSIASVQTSPQKNSLHPSYPRYVWQSKTKSITIRLMIQFSIFPSLDLVTKKFWSPTFNHHNWQPKNFSCLILVTIINNQNKLKIFGHLWLLD